MSVYSQLSQPAVNPVISDASDAFHWTWLKLGDEIDLGDLAIDQTNLKRRYVCSPKDKVSKLRERDFDVGGPGLDSSCNPRRKPAKIPHILLLHAGRV